MTAAAVTSTEPSDAHACCHSPACPTADATDHDAARVIASFGLQGWSLLCNGTVVFADTGELAPDNRSVAPHRPNPLHRTAER